MIPEVDYNYTSFLLPEPIHQTNAGALYDLNSVEACHDQSPVGRRGRLSNFSGKEIQHGVGDHVVEEQNLLNNGFVYGDVVNGADQIFPKLYKKLFKSNISQWLP